MILKSLFYEIKESNINGLGLFSIINIESKVILDAPTKCFVSCLKKGIVKNIRPKEFLFQESKTDFSFVNEGFINHSDDPNLVFLYGNLITVKNIKVGDEFTLNYKTLLKEKDAISFAGNVILGLSEMESNNYSINLLKDS